jgi:hypothetical protein
VSTYTTNNLSTNESTRAVPAAGARSRPGSALLYLIRCEILKLVRVPMFAIPTFVFPIMFFAMFGLPNIRRPLDGINAGAYMMACLENGHQPAGMSACLGSIVTCSPSCSRRRTSRRCTTARARSSKWFAPRSA